MEPTTTAEAKKPKGGADGCLESQGLVSMREIWIAFHYPAANPSGKRAVSR